MTTKYLDMGFDLHMYRFRLKMQEMSILLWALKTALPHHQIGVCPRHFLPYRLFCVGFR